jgi:hypothetical protein
MGSSRGAFVAHCMMIAPSCVQLHRPSPIRPVRCLHGQFASIGLQLPRRVFLDRDRTRAARHFKCTFVHPRDRFLIRVGSFPQFHWHMAAYRLWVMQYDLRRWVSQRRSGPQHSNICLTLKVKAKERRGCMGGVASTDIAVCCVLCVYRTQWTTVYCSTAGTCNPASPSSPTRDLA